MAELVTIAGPDEGRTVTLGPRCVIGRHADCDFAVDDDTVSRRHALITRDADGWYIEDLGSSNGTFVNGKEVRGRSRLLHGDTIKLSRAVLSFRHEPELSSTSVAIVAEETHNSAVINPQEAVATILGDSRAFDRLDQLQDIHQKLLTMTRFSEAISSTLDLGSLLDRVLALLFDVFPQGERAFVMLYDDNRNLKPAASRSQTGAGAITVSSTVLDTVVKRRHAILSNNPLGDTRFGGGRSIVSTGLRSLMAAPLVYADELLGVIHIDTTKPRAHFGEDDLAFFGGLAAASVSVAIANARLHENLMRRQRLEQELSIAQAVQRSFLPSRLPQTDKVDIAFHYALAYQVGGDLYDVIDLPDGRLACTIGDVSGKGIPAALLMAKTISEMRFAAGRHKSPGNMLSMVNSLMLGSLSAGMFVTAVVCFYDTATGRASIADAGHNPPILKLSDGSAQTMEPAKGFPLGVVDDGQFRDMEVHLEPGDTLLLYTDGVTDATDSSGATFGMERLLDSACRAKPGARNVVDRILSDVSAFVGLARPFDDLTMIAFTPK